MPLCICITGVNGYMGRHVVTSLQQSGHSVIGIGRQTDSAATGITYLQADINDSSKLESVFQHHQIDVVLHLASIVHDAGRHAAEAQWTQNTRSSIALAHMSRKAGVKQFIFMSSIGVYGGEIIAGEREKKIDAHTPCNPQTPYEHSKWEAEQGILPQDTEQFGVLVVRPPMVYGKNCPGNYRRLRNIALRLGRAPSYHNQRSMILIDNLVSFLQQAVECNLRGIFCPQDAEYTDTAAMMSEILHQNGKTPKQSAFLKAGIQLAYPFLSPVRKAFGSLWIDSSLSDPGFFYQVVQGLSARIAHCEPFDTV